MAEPKGREAAPPPAPASMSMTITEMQQRLTELGYGPGSADGKMGPRTVTALKKFQHDHKLPITGALDQQTINALHKR
jgi:peptidoglycan hydrolase-like protein with peptidoglycan-binding domain